MEMNYGLPYTPVAANTLLAKVYSEAFGDHEQSEANARLIAAAPDLLEALRECSNIVSVFVIGCDADNAVERANAAIAKAMGKSV
jgi:hypothetical protein